MRTRVARGDPAIETESSRGLAGSVGHEVGGTLPVLRFQRTIGNHATTALLVSREHASCKGCSRCGGTDSDGTRLARTESGAEPQKRVPTSVYDTLGTTGQPLGSAVRMAAESWFGADFSSVRVHTDAAAAKSAWDVDAHAYAVGEHIVFAEGGIQPGSRSGLRTLAHELTHVLQQRTSTGVRSRWGVSRPEDAEEQHAKGVADRVVAGQPAPAIRGGFATSGLARAARDDRREDVAASTMDEAAAQDNGVDGEQNEDDADSQQAIGNSMGGGLWVQRDERTRSRSPRPHTPPVPTLGGCRPARHDHAPAAPWGVLQAGFQARCGSATRDVMGQAGGIVDALLHGRAPRGVHLPDPRSSIDCVCANSSPRTAAVAAAARVGVAGPLALDFYTHFLDASGADRSIAVAEVIARDAGVRRVIRRSIARGGSSGTTRINQSDYSDSDFQFAFGAIDCVQWRALPPAGRRWRRDDRTNIEVSMLDYYEFHPERQGVSQCAHAACVELVARSQAKNFWMRGTGAVRWGILRT
jgi:hypothetical protein